jgi:disulfide bond formation protein DsbB
MTPFVTVVTYCASVGIVIMNIVTLFLIFVVVTSKNDSSNKLLSWISLHNLKIVFLVSIASILGSLFYSEIAGFVPCEFCWFQRIMLIAEALVFAGALSIYRNGGRENPGIFRSTFIISLFAIFVGAFQYYGSMFNPGLLDACVANGVSCAKNYFIIFGYITIPWMALSTFLLLAILLYIKIRHIYE